MIWSGQWRFWNRKSHISLYGFEIGKTFKETVHGENKETNAHGKKIDKNEAEKIWVACGEGSGGSSITPTIVDQWTIIGDCRYRLEEKIWIVLSINESGRKDEFGDELY